MIRRRTFIALFVIPSEVSADMHNVVYGHATMAVYQVMYVE